MAFTGSAICNSFKQEILAMTPHAAGDVYKIALFTSSATLSKSTTSYTGAANEVANGNGYTTGGKTLVGFNPVLDGDQGILDWSTNPAWSAATFTARGALIYNDSHAGKQAIAVIDFGSDITATAGTFTVQFPAPTTGVGLIRIS